VEVVSWRACNLYDIAAGEDLELIVGVIAVGSPDLDRVANEVLKAEVVIEDAEVTASMVVGSG
jgi:predicted glycosyltransferase